MIVTRPTPLPDRLLKTFRDKARPTGTLPDPNAKPEPPAPKTPAKPSEAKPPKPKAEPEFGEQPQDENEEEQPETEPQSGEETETEQPGAETPKPDAAKAGEKPPGPKRDSPWKLADHWKKKAAILEHELAAAKKGAIPEAQAKEYTERIEKAESRVKELEDEIRFVNYQNHPEFKEKYQKPYETAFKRAVAELSEVQVNLPDGSQRPASAEDILALVSLPLGEARRLADGMFGPFADDAMGHRKEIKALFDTRQAALEEAKTTGAAREKQQYEEYNRLTQAVSKEVAEVWTKANQEVLKDERYSRYFTPREGDEEWNKRLARGFDLTDKAFSDPNPRDPRLSAEERQEIVRRHAAVRNRAASFGPLRYENEQLRSRVEELEKQLKEYQSSEPGSSGGSHTAPKPDETGYTMDRLFQSIRKRAR